MATPADGPVQYMRLPNDLRYIVALLPVASRRAGAPTAASLLRAAPLVAAVALLALSQLAFAEAGPPDTGALQACDCNADCAGGTVCVVNTVFGAPTCCTPGDLGCPSGPAVGITTCAIDAGPVDLPAADADTGWAAPEQPPPDAGLAPVPSSGNTGCRAAGASTDVAWVALVAACFVIRNRTRRRHQS